ncbi:MAG: hypothetical protein ACUVQ4_06600 [bacterium]
MRSESAIALNELSAGIYTITVHSRQKMAKGIISRMKKRTANFSEILNDVNTTA